MNESAKEWISKLMFAYEQLYLERYALESLLVGAKVPGWKPMYERLLRDTETKKHVHALFQPIADLLQREIDEEAEFEQLLLKLPRSGQIH